MAWHHLARGLLPGRLRQQLALAKQWLGLRAFRPYVARHCYGGLPLQINIVDATSRRWYDMDWECPEEIAVLAERGQLRPGATVFDIGAHQALVAMLLAARVAPNGRVIAVEPTPHNIWAARCNLADNQQDGVVELVHAAASDVPGTLRFVPGLNGHVTTSGAVGIDVPAITVDQLATRVGPPHVVFIDVEGFEIQAVRGAREVLRSARPDLFIEVHAGVGLEAFGTVDDLLALIPADYTILVSPTTPTNFRPLANDPEARHVLKQHSLLIALAGR